MDISKNKQAIALGIVAVALVVVSVMGLEDRIFPNRVDVVQENASFKSATAGGVAAGASLKDKLAKSWGQAFIVAKRVVEDLNAVAQVASEDDDSADFAVIRLMGIMRGADGQSQAILNGSLLRVGGMVNGCQVVTVEPGYVELLANGKLTTLKINEEFRFRRRAFKELVLERIVRKGSVWKAKINGYLYRAGDQIDTETQVRAVTPTEVLVMRAGTVIVLDNPVD